MCLPLRWPALPLAWQCGIFPAKNFPILISFRSKFRNPIVGASLACLAVELKA
jgi:hypothetical protein